VRACVRACVPTDDQPPPQHSHGTACPGARQSVPGASLGQSPPVGTCASVSSAAAASALTFSCSALTCAAARWGPIPPLRPSAIPHKASLGTLEAGPRERFHRRPRLMPPRLYLPRSDGQSGPQRSQRRCVCVCARALLCVRARACACVEDSRASLLLLACAVGRERLCARNRRGALGRALIQLVSRRLQPLFQMLKHLQSVGSAHVGSRRRGGQSGRARPAPSSRPRG